MMFHPSGTCCAQNVRFYLEATIIVHGEVLLPICCFPRYSQMLGFGYIYFYLTCSFLLACWFLPKWGHLCPRCLEVIFSREWDHVCPRYLGVMFHSSGTICAQNVRFYIEATIVVHGEIILPICCFPPFSELFAFACIYFCLTCSFLLACRFSPEKQLLLWRSYFANLLLFSPVSRLFAFVYIYFYSTCPFLLALRFF